MAARLVLLSLCICATSAQHFFDQQQRHFTSSPRVLQNPAVEILRVDSAGPRPDGSYSFSFEDSTGTRREEVAQATGPNTFAVQGTYRYTNEDGTVVEVRYRADESGYHAESPALPQAPPMPQHAIEQLRIAEEQKRQGVVFDQRGFIVNGKGINNQGAFKQQKFGSQSFFRNGF
ncbi:cuticle protein AM1159-like isoform X2 [Oratosquilla oratoria]|uniref:cuticle protein AM1159-like isoform X2 n=1 Tax=Oratosquilla oratoria TaxID=337810 RepID=UPI003F7584F5